MKFIDKILKMVFNSHALTLFFGVMAYWLFFTKKNKKHSSDDTVNNAIYQIDSAINALGTFDKDLNPIIDLFKSLSKHQTITLYNDFGTRFYNSLTGKYKLINTGGFAGFTQELNLQSLLQKEMDDSQLNKLKIIHNEKGLSFPFK